MKVFLYSFILVALMGSCTKRDNSSVNTPCTDSCTTVQGRVLTGNNEPVGGVSFEIRSERKPTLGIGQKTIRKIATGKTDNNGFYSFSFSLKQGEYNVSNSFLYLTVQYDKNKFLPIPWYEQFGTDEIIPVAERKDTTITMNYYLASKAQIKVQLNGFVPASPADSFYILTIYHDVGYDKRQATDGQFVVATQVNNEKTLAVAGNQQNKISVVRKKNGIRTISDTLVFTPTNQTTTVTLNY